MVEQVVVGSDAWLGVGCPGVDAMIDFIEERVAVGDGFDQRRTCPTNTDMLVVEDVVMNIDVVDVAILANSFDSVAVGIDRRWLEEVVTDLGGSALLAPDVLQPYVSIPVVMELVILDCGAEVVAHQRRSVLISRQTVRGPAAMVDLVVLHQDIVGRGDENGLALALGSTVGSRAKARPFSSP